MLGKRAFPSGTRGSSPPTGPRPPALSSPLWSLFPHFHPETPLSLAKKYPNPKGFRLAYNFVADQTLLGSPLLLSVASQGLFPSKIEILRSEIAPYNILTTSSLTSSKSNSHCVNTDDTRAASV